MRADANNCGLFLTVLPVACSDWRDVFNLAQLNIKLPRNTEQDRRPLRVIATRLLASFALQFHVAVVSRRNPMRHAITRVTTHSRNSAEKLE